MKKLLLFCIVFYIVFSLGKQQIELYNYDKQKKEYRCQIEKAEQKKIELYKTSQELSSPEYIEKVAREKLGMIKSYEIMYVDSNR